LFCSFKFLGVPASRGRGGKLGKAFEESSSKDAGMEMERIDHRWRSSFSPVRIGPRFKMGPEKEPEDEVIVDRGSIRGKGK